MLCSECSLHFLQSFRQMFELCNTIHHYNFPSQPFQFTAILLLDLFFIDRPTVSIKLLFLNSKSDCSWTSTAYVKVVLTLVMAGLACPVPKSFHITLNKQDS
jgi:hypothetical protein